MRRLVFPRLMLLVVLTALSAGCTGSAESAGGTDVPTDGAQSSQSIQTPHERIVTFSGFDRDDVPNLSLHVLRVPSLGLVKRTDVDLDAIVELDQIGHSGYLRGRADNTPPSFFSVDSEYHIREVAETDIPDAAFGEPGSQPRVTLSDDKVKFGFDKAELSTEAKAALDAFAAQLKTENRNVYVEVQGHTDNVGGELYNEKLGKQRAEAVEEYLAKQGIPLFRIESISYGESEPVADNKTREGRAQNRRVVLVVLQ